MELTFVYFWVIKAVFGAVLGLVVFLTFKFSSKFFGFIVVLLLLLLMYAPIRMDTGTRSQQIRSNNFVKQQNLILPSRITDNSFKESTESITGISKKDLE